MPAGERGEQDDPAGPLDQGDHRTLPGAAQEQVALPVARHRPIRDLGRAGLDPDVLGDAQGDPFSPAGLGFAPLTARAKVRGQLPLELTLGLDDGGSFGLVCA